MNTLDIQLEMSCKSSSSSAATIKEPGELVAKISSKFAKSAWQNLSEFRSLRAQLIAFVHSPWIGSANADGILSTLAVLLSGNKSRDDTEKERHSSIISLAIGQAVE